MASETLFDHGTKVPDGTFQDGSYVCGLVVEPSTDGTFDSIWYYRDASEPETSHYVYVFSNDGNDTLLGSGQSTGESGSGWYEIALDTPVSVTANTQYIVAVDFYASAWPWSIIGSLSGFGTSGADNGSYLTAPTSANDDQAIGNGRWTYSNSAGGQDFPSGHYNGEGYAVDVTFTPGNGVVEGAGSSDGSSTAAGGGATVAEASGSSDGTSSASGEAGATAEASGASDGSSSSSGAAASVAEALGSSSGVATVSGQAGATAEATGSSAGGSTAAAAGSTTGGTVSSGAGSSVGSSTAAGEGQAVFPVPSRRTESVSAQSRVATVAASIRTATVAAGSSRTVVVAAQTSKTASVETQAARLVTVQAEAARTANVTAQNRTVQVAV